MGDAEAVGNAEGHADVGADVEELVLHALEHRAQRVRERRSEREADLGVQLVDRSVRGDQGIALRGPRAVAERGLAEVTAARVDPRQPDRLVALARHEP